MTEHQREALLNRILAAKYTCIVDDTKYHIVYPDPDVRLEADYLYNKTIDENKFEILFTRKAAKRWLARTKIWTPENQKNLKEIDKTMEDLKVKIFESALSKKLVETTRTNLRNVEAKKEEMLSRKFSLDHITLEGYATFVRNMFLYISTIRDKEMALVWDEYRHASSPRLQVIINEFNRNRISIPTGS